MAKAKKETPRSRELIENCRNHPDIEASGRCAQCWGFFCDDCLEKVGDHRYCEACCPEARRKYEAAMAAKQESRRRLDMRLLLYALSGVLATAVIAGVLYFNGVISDFFASYVPAYQITNQAAGLGSKTDGFQLKTTKHFNIYYHNEQLAITLAPLAEEYLDSILKDTLIYEKDVMERGKFNILMPADDTEFKRLYPDVPETRIALSDYATKTMAFAETSDLATLRQNLAHELTHGIIFERFNSANRVPDWLNEGLASYEEARIDPSQVTARWVEYGPVIAGGGYIPINQLAATETVGAEAVNRFYAESYSIVDYLIRNYGMLKLVKLFSKMQSGQDLDAALRETYPKQLDGVSDLEQKWLASL